ncbi:MAG TPA: hypothetical protein V6C65_11605, partial [Allocoleopsis sp.]
MRSRFSLLGLITVLISISLPLQAQESNTTTEAPFPAFPNTCEALAVVGGEGSEVTKEISPPGVNIPLPGPVSAGTRNNWHTDWIVPGGSGYQTYMVMFMPRTTREYDVTMYLKYPDDTNQRFYREQRTNFTANQVVTVEVTPERSDLAPYQVN